MFLSLMMRMVRKSIELANQPPLTEELHVERAKSWAESLWGIVPDDEREIFAIWRKAVSMHQSTFPISAYDFKSAWDVLREERAANPVQTQLALSATTTTNCQRCFGTGMEMIYNSEGQQIGVRKGCLHEFVDETDPNAAGIDIAIGAAKTPVRDDSAVILIRRLRGQVFAEHAAEPEYGDRLDALAAAIRTLDRADRYLRGLEVEW